VALGRLEKMLVRSLDDLADCDVVLVNHRRVDASQVVKWLAAEVIVFDLADIPDVKPTDGYEGIAW
jgi:hypothetical protein